jgi:hypothetical protein
MTSREELNILKSLSAEKHFRSSLNFLNEHNGWRRGKIHTLLGVSHGGKSTMIRTLVRDVVKSLRAKQMVGLYLSEESESEMLIELSHIDDIDLNRLIIFSEQDYKTKDSAKLFFILGKLCEKTSIVFLDNITTSRLYADKKISDQTEMALDIKQLAAEKMIPIIIVSHTGKKIGSGYAKMIEMDDIRGCSTLVNISHFFYVLQSFHIGNERHNILRITKNRGQNVENTIYKLFYYTRSRIFGKDEPKSFSEFKEIFRSRNVL